jgi:tetratricopeptide (TPR) repeat protein
MASYQKLLESNPNNPGIYERLGQLSLQQGHWEEALRYYRHLVETYPENANLYHALAEVYRQQAQWEEAIKVYQQALEHGLMQPEILTEMGKLYERIGQQENALTAYQQSIDAGETRFDTFLRVEQLGPQYNNSGERQLLWETYALANKQSSEALFHLVKYYHERGEWLHAVTLAKEVIANAPAHPEYRQFLASLYERQGMLPETIEQWEKLVKMHTGNISYHLRLAALYEQVGDQRKARTQYRRILRLVPEHQQARQKLSKLGD